MTERNSHPWRPWLLFLLPSLAGASLFMMPVRHGDGLSIPVAGLARMMQDALGGAAGALLLALCALSLGGSLAALWRKPVGELARRLFAPAPLWVVVRALGALFAALVFFGVGPEFLRAGGTGGLIFGELMPTLLCVFILAGMLLPLLLNFGLLEFFGTLMTPVMRPLFRLPGRSAIDCMASWLGDGSIGVLMSSRQYEQGHYNSREAAIIGTCFSSVSISFCLVVMVQVGLERLFLPMLGIVFVTGMITAAVLCRVPPLSRKPAHYHSAAARQEAHEQGHIWRRALDNALRRAAGHQSWPRTLAEGGRTVADMLLGILPAVMCIGTLGLVLAEYTPLFAWLGAPFVPLLELLALPQAEQAGRAVVAGFADMFLPAIMVAELPSPLTRFVIAALSVTQLIYLSEIGALLLGSSIPVRLWELAVLFILRTLISLPIIALLAHLLVF